MTNIPMRVTTASGRCVIGSECVVPRRRRADGQGLPEGAFRLTAETADFKMPCRSRARPLRTRAGEQHRCNEITCGTEYCVQLPRGVACCFQQQEARTLAKWAHRGTVGANQPHRPARQRWESNPSRPRGSSQRDERLHAQGRDGESVPECRRSCQAQPRHPVRAAFGAPDPLIDLGDPAADLVRTGMAPRIPHPRAAVCLPLVLLRPPPIKHGLRRGQTLLEQFLAFLEDRG